MESDESEPDLNDLHDPEWVRAREDAAQAAVHYALEEFHRNMEEHERQKGRRFTREQRQWHLDRFKSRLLRVYGWSEPSAAWLQRKAEWDAR